MVVVKIELWPSGDQIAAQEIARGYIINDNSGDHKYGNYEVELEHGGTNKGKPGYYKKGSLKRHPRNLSPYHLVAKAFHAALASHGPCFQLQPGQTIGPPEPEPGEEG